MRAALTNLAHVELARGRFRHAAHFFERAARMSPPAGTTQAGITDGLAQLSLARGDLDEADAHPGDGTQMDARITQREPGTTASGRR